MLQQTQVDRVIPYYKEFLRKFPTEEILAEAPLQEVLRTWQGLGYNRRAKMLHEAVKVITTIHQGVFPHTYSELIKLPGIGDYTAKAVRVFAFNEPEVMIETNIRAVMLHHFFPKKNNVSDIPINRYIAKTLDMKNPREWYAALMDYGTYLKKTTPNPSRKSRHHTKQKPFKGSDREIRGAILKAHLAGTPLSRLPFDSARIAQQRVALKREGLI